MSLEQGNEHITLIKSADYSPRCFPLYELYKWWDACSIVRVFQGLDQHPNPRMFLRKYTVVTLFATSLALASQTQWQSGDCIDKEIGKTGTRIPQNKPSACISWCKETNNFTFAAVKEDWCACSSEDPGSVRINKENCKTPCPGEQDSVCGGEFGWYNIFSTDAKLSKIKPHRCRWKVCEQFTPRDFKLFWDHA